MAEKETPAQARERIYQQARKDAPAKKAAAEMARKGKLMEDSEKEMVIIDRPRGDGDRPWLRTLYPNNRADKIIKDATGE